MNGIDPAELSAGAADRKLPELLQRKLADLSVLYGAYRKRLGEKLTAEERLPLFARLLPASDIGKADHLYLDGFTGFTGIQYRILEQLMARAGETTAVLTLPEGEDPEAWFDPKKRHRDELYAMSQETVWRLMRIAEEHGIKHDDIRYSHFAPERPEELAFLSRRLMQPGREIRKGRPETIRLICPETPEEEAAWAVSRIRYLLREKGLRCRDIALLVSDQELYVPLLEKYLKEAQLPFFTDRRLSLKAHPLLRLLEDAWETVSGGRERDAFLRYVKNPCGPLSREECDRLENYLLAAGIRGGKRLEERYSRPVKRCDAHMFIKSMGSSAGGEKAKRPGRRAAKKNWPNWTRCGKEPSRRWLPYRKRSGGGNSPRPRLRARCSVYVKNWRRRRSCSISANAGSRKAKKRRRPAGWKRPRRPSCFCARWTRSSEKGCSAERRCRIC